MRESCLPLRRARSFPFAHEVSAMGRFSLAIAAAILATGSAFAQYPNGVVSHFGGEFPRSTFFSPNYYTPRPATSPLYPYTNLNYGGMAGQGRAFGAAGFGYGGFGYGGFGFGGGFYGNPYYSSYYAQPPVVTSADYYLSMVPAYPSHIVALSGEMPATLALQFPAAATVWLNEKEVVGKSETTRTLTSPVLSPGEKFTFHVRARWKANGQTYETTREAVVGAGDRSKLFVVSGTKVKEDQ